MEISKFCYKCLNKNNCGKLVNDMQDIIPNCYSELKFKIITLCGSTKFKNEFLEQQKRLTLGGNIVISVGLFGHSGDNEVWINGTKEMLDIMHKVKIDMCDEIFVIDVNKYIGESTMSEIDYARMIGKPVLFYSEYLKHVKLINNSSCEEICLGCNHCEIIENGCNGFIGETILRCKICEEENENKNECYESEDTLCN